jgi:hypothetical protein
MSIRLLKGSKTVDQLKGDQRVNTPGATYRVYAELPRPQSVRKGETVKLVITAGSAKKTLTVRAP